MMKQILMIVILGLMMGCEEKTETVYVDVTALPASQLYRIDSVYAYMELHQDKHKDLAEAYYKKARACMANNPERAVYYLKRSISLQPRLETYKELVAQLQKLERYEEAQELYNLLVYKRYSTVNNVAQESYLFGPPDEDTFYEHLVIGIIKWKYLSGEDMYLMSELGQDQEKIKERLQKEPRILLDRNSVEFKNILLQFLPYDKLDSIARQPETFRSFLTSIRDTAERFEISENAVREFDYAKWDGSDMYDMISPESIQIFYLKEKQENKDAWIKFNINHYYRPFPSVIALVYAIDTSATACPLDMRHIYHRLVTMNDSGRVIDSKVIAFQSGEGQTTARINKENIAMQLYKRSWKKAYDKWDFNNQLLDTKVTGTEQYAIKPDGSIQQVSAADTP